MKRKNSIILNTLALTCTLTCTGCAELHQRALGTKVNTFTIKGVDYVHCSILLNKADPQFAHDAIEVCRDVVMSKKQK